VLGPAALGNSLSLCRKSQNLGGNQILLIERKVMSFFEAWVKHQGSFVAAFARDARVPLIEMACLNSLTLVLARDCIKQLGG